MGSLVGGGLAVLCLLLLGLYDWEDFVERKAPEDNVGRFEGVDGADGCQVQFTSWMVEGIGFLW